MEVMPVGSMEVSTGQRPRISYNAQDSQLGKGIMWLKMRTVLKLRNPGLELNSRVEE